MAPNNKGVRFPFILTDGYDSLAGASVAADDTMVFWDESEDNTKTLRVDEIASEIVTVGGLQGGWLPEPELAALGTGSAPVITIVADDAGKHYLYPVNFGVVSDITLQDFVNLQDGEWVHFTFATEGNSAGNNPLVLNHTDQPIPLGATSGTAPGDNSYDQGIGFQIIGYGTVTISYRRDVAAGGVKYLVWNLYGIGPDEIIE